MPMTFLSHQAVVLPLKIGAPRWFSGTALVLGSMAPDVEYFLRGYPSGTISHTWPGQVIFCMPVTLVLYWLVTRVIAAPAAAHAPAGGGLRLREYALLAEQPAGLRHWTTVTVSALIGSSSHVLLDRVADRIGGVPYHVLQPPPGVVALNVALWVVLGAITVWLMRYIGRNGLLARWVAERAGIAPTPEGQPASNAPAPADRIAAFWGWVLLCAIAGGILGAIYRRSGFFMHQPATWVHIWLCSVSGGFLGLLAASAAWHARRPRVAQLRGGQQ